MRCEDSDIGEAEAGASNLQNSSAIVRTIGKAVWKLGGG
jgi:hypothetical protein